MKKYKHYILGVPLTIIFYILLYYTVLKEYNFGVFFGEITFLELIVYSFGFIIITLVIAFLIILIPVVFWEMVKSIFNKK